MKKRRGPAGMEYRSLRGCGLQGKYAFWAKDEKMRGDGGSTPHKKLKLKVCSLSISEVK